MKEKKQCLADLGKIWNKALSDSQFIIGRELTREEQVCVQVSVKITRNYFQSKLDKAVECLELYKKLEHIPNRADKCLKEIESM